MKLVNSDFKYQITFSMNCMVKRMVKKAILFYQMKRKK